MLIAMSKCTRVQNEEAHGDRIGKFSEGRTRVLNEEAHGDRIGKFSEGRTKCRSPAICIRIWCNSLTLFLGKSIRTS